MDTVRAFCSGVALPALILPFGMLILMFLGKTEVLEMPSIHFIPVFWGVWNTLYFGICKSFLPENLDIRLFITGGLLGLLVALYGVFGLKLPAIIGLQENVYYAPIIAVPILYGILWRFIVKPLNDLVGLHDA